MSPGFTVVVNNYNYRHFVGEAIDSALAQTLPARQVIVVDDGSSDGSAEWLRERYGSDARVTLLTQENQGQLSALIAGVTAARGDVVCFLDADDAWEPRHLEQLAGAYGHPSKPDFVFTNMRRFGNRDGLWYDSLVDHDFGLSAIPTLALRHWEASPTSAISMRLALARTILLDLPEAIRNVSIWRTRADDVLAYGAALFHGRKRYLGEPTVRYRVHGENSWFERSFPAVLKMRHIYACDQLIAYYAQRSGLSPRSLLQAKSEFMTKPRPRADELRMYRRSAWVAPASLGKRLELVFGLYRYYWRTRRATE